MKLDRNVLSGNLHIKGGRKGVTPEDKDMCVISEELAKQNNLKIGDKISFNDYHDTENSKVSEAEIVGIYQVDQKMCPLMPGRYCYFSENVIFTNLRFSEKAEGETSPLYERAYFKVEDVEAYDEVKENLQKVDIDWEQYDLIDNNGNSETMSSNFNDLAKVSEMMIVVISVASFVILVLVFLFWLKNRVQEVGIFLSLGVPKFRIIGQIWSEAIMIAVLSLMLSFAVAPAVSKVTANYLVSQQVRRLQERKRIMREKYPQNTCTKAGRAEYQHRGYTRNVSTGRGKCSCIDNGFCSGIWNCNTKEKSKRYFIGNELGGRRKC